jgi:hypothetical protein
MVALPLVKALDDHLTRVSKVLKNLDGLFIDMVGVVVLSQSTIVVIAQF